MSDQHRWERVLLVFATFLLSRNKDIHTVGQVVRTAASASERAERAVNKAIAEGNASSASLNPQLTKAFTTLEEIKQELNELLATKGTP